MLFKKKRLFEEPLLSEKCTYYIRKLFGWNENVGEIMVAGRVDIDSASSFFNADESVCIIDRNIWNVFVNIFLDLLIIIQSLCFILFCNCFI